METITVKSSRGNYKILTGSGFLKKAGDFLLPLKTGKNVLVVSQTGLPSVHKKLVIKSLSQKGFQVKEHILPDGEKAKSEKELFRILKALVLNGFDRSDVLLAIGGGVAGDLAGFAASCFMRGIGFVNIPTTLLAQVDSSIGGKTAVNLSEGKNLVGAFWPPRLVISDMDTLKTLPERELRAALGEVMKYGVISRPDLFQFLEQHSQDIFQKKSAALEKIVSISARIKAGVVSRDEYETKGERMILNYGHTFGHAFEKAMNYRGILHGEAISVGMICAGNMAERLGIFSAQDNQRLLHLTQKLNLPVHVKGKKISVHSAVEALKRDKKKKAGALRFVLPVRIGKVIVRSDIDPSLVEEIFEKAGCNR